MTSTPQPGETPSKERVAVECAVHYALSEFLCNKSFTLRYAREHVMQAVDVLLAADNAKLRAELDALRTQVAQFKAERENWRASSVCRELRAQLDAERRLRREVLVPALRFVVEQTDHHYDPEADINDESPEDMHAHINGLLRKEADTALAQSAELDRKQEGAP